MRVLYNGVNLEQFRPDHEGAKGERERFRLCGPVVLYLGRVCRQKGTDVLLAAWSVVRNIRPDAQLVIAGPMERFDGGTGDTDWEQRIRRVGGRYIGQVPDPRLSGLLTMADVFVMPTTELEMFGMAAVEALACGTPVVTTDHGGLKETVPETTGIRVLPGDPGQLADAILRVLGDARLRSVFAQAGRLHAQRFGWDQIAAGLDASYRASMERVPTR
jgi:glycosyltransferase involved in cell wall biosynthesis